MIDEDRYTAAGILFAFCTITLFVLPADAPAMGLSKVDTLALEVILVFTLADSVAQILRTAAGERRQNKLRERLKGRRDR